MRRKKSSTTRTSGDTPAAGKMLRIIGGSLRNRSIRYHGDPRTRPMKDRVREAVFNLIGPAVRGKHAIDLFAGTGALGFEAISRGAARATLIERHFPTARIIRENSDVLGIQEQCRVSPGDAFLWLRQQGAAPELEEPPWLVLCSPPYDFYVERQDQMQALLRELVARGPDGSLFVVESDQRFDFGYLTDLGDWDIRSYPPAKVGLLSPSPI